jgi:hypothetical protein
MRHVKKRYYKSRLNSSGKAYLFKRNKHKDGGVRVTYTIIVRNIIFKK